MSRNVESVTVTGTRDMRFGEILVVRPGGIEVYNTTGSSDCALEVWDALEPDKLAAELGAQTVLLNGPKYWMMDSQTVSLGDKASFGGLDARWAATLDPALARGAIQGADPYTVFTPKKTQKMVYDRGKPVFELVDPEGHAYVLQAHGREFTLESLPQLGSRMKQLPEGWEYRSRTPDDDVVLDLGPDDTIHAVGDEFRQYYTRIPRAG